MADTPEISDDLMALAGDDPAESPPADNPLLSRMGVDMSRMLTFDFETGPDTERLHQFNLPDVNRTPLEKCPPVEEFFRQHKTVKDVEKGINDLLPCHEWLDLVWAAEEETEKPRKGVLKAMEELWQREAEMIKVMSTTPRYAKITAFGWAIGNGEVEGRVISHAEQPEMDCTEVEMLELFWDLVEECHPLVGYHVKAFDLPLALTRSAILGVRPTRRVKLAKYSNNEVIDLFTDQGLSKGPCKEVCKDFGIEVPAGDMDGSQAWAAYLANPESLRTYVRSDVEIERRLFWLLSGYFWD